VQEELGVTMYTPAGCGGRRRVRPVGLARGAQGPVDAVILVADDKVQSCEHGEKKSLELQESMTPVGGPFGGTELGPLGLGREGEGLVVRHLRLLPSTVQPGEKKKRKEVHTVLGSSSIIAHVVHSPPPPPANSFVIGPAVINTHTQFSRSLPRELEELDAGWSTLGGAALDAGGRSGQRWTSDD